MNVLQLKNILCLVTCLGFAQGVQAALINGDFETGDLTGWSTFTYSIPPSTGGFDVAPSVVLFDTNGDSNTSQAASFRVGQIAGSIGGGTPRVGGGITQSLNLQSGQYSFSADIAASSVSNNADGGFFEFLLDDIVLDLHDFGSIGVGTIERSMHSFSTVVTAGIHTVSLRMSRGYGTSANTPTQYIDNVSVSQVPEPATLALFGIGLAGMGFARRKKKSA